MGKAKSGEQALLSKLLKSVRSSRVRLPGLVTGVGDDAAVFRGPGCDYVVTQDVQVDGHHFDRRWMTPRQIGWRLAAVNLSDIAAMGGQPLYGLLSIVIPRRTGHDYVAGIEKGVIDHLRRYGAAVIGGNISAGAGGLVCDMTLIGSCAVGRAWTRRARAGDAVVVVGGLGDAAAGLELLRKQGRKVRSRLVSAFVRPRPLLDVARLLASDRAVRAAIDVSDGFSTDVLHMCESGDVGVEVQADRLPVSRALKTFCKKHKTPCLPFLLGGGEDYALILSVKPSAVDRICRRVSSTTGSSATVVGRFTRDTRRILLNPGGATSVPLVASGWQHQV